jgi:hypothetical protein
MRQRKSRPLCKTPTGNIHSSQQRSSARVDAFLNEPVQSPNHQRLFTLKELQDTINTLKPKKAPGQDNITAVILQQLPRKGQIKLLYIFNAILRLDSWPRPLKTAQAIMIFYPQFQKSLKNSYSTK